MRRATRIALAYALAMSGIAPLSFAQSATRAGASTVVGSTGPQSQTSSSTFLGSIDSGHSSWQAGNGSFGKRENSNGTRPELVDLRKQAQAGRSMATPVAPRSESARSTVEKRFAVHGLKAEAPTPQPTVTTVAAQRNFLTHKKRLPPPVAFGAPRTTGNPAGKPRSGSLLSGGSTKTKQTGALTSSSSVNAQFRSGKP